MTEQQRNGVYATLTAIVALLGSFGIVTEAQAALWLALGSAILGLIMAFTYTTKKYGRHAKGDE